MLRRLKEHRRTGETIFLAGLSLICFTLSIVRFIYTDTKAFQFLNWNLFLAFLPWLFSSLLTIYPGARRSKIALIILVASWLLFFPNAPYILTDLFHLSYNSSAPIWFDLVLILSYAWAGLLFGFLSLWDIERILGKKIRKNIIPFISAILLFLGSFGIYLGRYLRWNSWDIIAKPYELFYSITDKLTSPLQHPRAWGMTILMFVFLSILYWSFRFMRYREVNGRDL